MKRHKGKRLEIWKPAAGEHSITIFPPKGGFVLERNLWDVKQEPVIEDGRQVISFNPTPNYVQCTGKFCQICSLLEQLDRKFQEFEEMLWRAMNELWHPYFQQSLARMGEWQDG